MASFDEVLVAVGSRGIWQWLILALSVLSNCATTAGLFSQGLLAVGAYAREFSCTSTRRRRLGSYLPLPQPVPNVCSVNNLTCTTFQFRSPYYNSTIPQEFQLVCDDEWRIALFQSAILCGYIFGLPVWALVGARFGRQLVALFAGFGIFIAPLINGHVAAYSQLLACRLIMGFCACGSWMALYSLNMEVNLPQRRQLVKALLTASFPIGIIVAAVFGFFIHDWRTLLRVISIPCFLTVPIAIILPESPRWLIVREHYARAERILRRAARINRQVYPNTLSLRRLNDGDNGVQRNVAGERQRRSTGGDRRRQNPDTIQRARSVERNAAAPSSQPHGISSSSVPVQKKWQWKPDFRHVQVHILALLIVLWMANFAVWFAVPYYLLSGHLSGNPYIISVILGCAKLAAHLAVYFLSTSTRIKRQGCWTMFVFNVLNGCALLVIAAVPLRSWIATALALMSAAAMEASFICMHQLTLDVLPGAIRNLSLCILSMFARLLAIGSPFVITLLPEIWILYPPILFGSLAIVASLLVLFLPDKCSARNREQRQSAGEAPEGGATENMRSTSVGQRGAAKADGFMDLTGANAMFL